MKKLVALFLAIVLMTSMLCGIIRADTGTTVSIYLEGDKVGFADVQPIHTGTRVLVPVRGFFERIGVTVDWNADDKIVIVKDDNQEIMLEVGNRAVLNNGAVEYLDCSVLSRDSRTFIPLRYISESFGYSVRWDGKTNSVHISKEPGSITGQEEDTSVLPTVNDIESLYQLLRYNDNMSYYLKDDDVRITPGIIDEDVQYEANGDASYDRPAGSASTQESNKSSDYSGTNNQVGGIEEADLIKTDGRYLYIVRDREITIANADPADLKVISKVDCDSGVSEIYIYEDKLVIINGNSRFEYLQGNAGERYILDLLFNGAFVRSTNVKVYDIENRAKPVLISDNDYEGRYLSSRMIDDDVYIVTNAAVQLNVGYYDDGEAMIFGADSRERFLKEVKRYPADELEMYLELTGLNSAEELYDACRNVFEMNAAPKHTDNIKGKTTVIDLKDVYYFKDMIRPNYMMTIGLDLNGGNKDINAYLGSTGEMYVSADHLYTALSAYEYSALKSKLQRYPVYNYLTTIHKFDLKDGKIVYESRGKVPGTILNQFSMDEYKGNFRIATTTLGGSSENNVYVLDKNMKITGKLEEIAEGEKIYSTRFAGDRIYMVTFRQMDPFFVIDAADPNELRVLGYLKIPGFSSYMHILDNDHVLGFGYDVEERKGWGLDTTGFKLSLFDVSDVSEPVEIKNEIIGEKAMSPLEDDHKALMISLDKGIMGFPIIYQNSETDYFAGYYLYNVSKDNFAYKDRVSHIPSGTDANDVVEEDMVFRGIYIGNHLYTFSENRLQVHDLNTMNKVGSLNFK